jgi:hypothetical protein
MRDLERDLRIVEAIAADLKPYLLSDALFWTLSAYGPVQNPYPKGTLGGLLFRLHLLDACRDRLSPDQWSRLADARRAAEGELRHWAVQAEQKAGREAASRLRAWETFLEEAADDPTRYSPEYHTQVEGRAILDFLIAFLGSAADGRLRGAAVAADRRLEALADEGSFTWDESIREAFPSDHFPYLYLRFRDE